MTTVLGNILLLMIEGAAISALIVPGGSWLLPLGMSLPVGALMNVFVTFVYTVLGIPLTQLSFFAGHFLILVVTAAMFRKNLSLIMDQIRPERIDLSRSAKLIVGASVVLLSMVTLYAIVHAAMLPSNQYDSATNWTMRSEISFYDHAIAFDADEKRGMAKPQYPFLYHALQISANQGLSAWSDTAANIVLLLLSLCTFGAVFSVIRHMRGFSHALVAVTLIAGIPLLGLHLAQGYGDINLVQYLLLSYVCLGAWIESADRRKERWLLLSGIFAAASVWTKSEGLLFGLVSWLVMVGCLCGKNRAAWKSSLLPVTTAVVLSVPWPVYAMLKGLSLTPHSSDTLFSFHAEGLSEAIFGLFSRGSFGIVWYALLSLMPVLAVAGWKHHPQVARREMVLLLGGLIVFGGFLFVYLCTPNVRFLLNAESYYRQMMLPAALLLLGCALSLDFRKKSVESVS